MAFDPTKIGAGYKYVETFLTNISTTASTQLVQFNPYRVALLMQCNSGTLFMRPNAPAVLNQGFEVQTSGFNFFKISIADSGPLCQQAWFGINNNAANTVYIISVEWIPEIVQ